MYERHLVHDDRTHIIGYDIYTYVFFGTEWLIFELHPCPVYKLVFVELVADILESEVGLE